jgi:hypothetical protein
VLSQPSLHFSDHDIENTDLGLVFYLPTQKITPVCTAFAEAVSRRQAKCYNAQVRRRASHGGATGFAHGVP